MIQLNSLEYSQPETRRILEEFGQFDLVGWGDYKTGNGTIASIAYNICHGVVLMNNQSALLAHFLPCQVKRFVKEITKEITECFEDLGEVNALVSVGNNDGEILKSYLERWGVERVEMWHHPTGWGANRDLIVVPSERRVMEIHERGKREYFFPEVAMEIA